MKCRVCNSSATSPIFDLTGNPSYYLTYNSWFSNGGGGWGGSSPADDSLTVSITNGIDVVVLENMTANSPNMGQWNLRNFQLSEYLTLTSTMQLIIETADWDALGGHWVEAGFDMFSISSSAPSSIDNIQYTDRRLVKITDVLGRDIIPNSNIPLFYIYSDGSVEKKVILD